MFYIIEFEDNALGIVRSTWLTPRKKECLWPPHKIASKFNKCLLSQELPDENWPLYTIKRVMYETDDLQLAREKCKKAESESDLVSDSEKSKKRKKKRKIASDTEDEDENYINFKYPDSPMLGPSTCKFKSSTEVNVEPQRKYRASGTPQLDSILSGELEYITSPKSPAAIVEKQIIQERGTPPIIRTDRRTEIKNYSPSNAHTSTARPLLQNLDFDTPSRSPCATPTEQKQSAFDKINVSLESIATYIASIQSDIKELKAMQNDILSRLTSSSSSAALIALPDDIALPLKSVEDLDYIETWLENDENKENLVNNLSFIGGNNIATITRRILQRVFSSLLALQCNWTGKNNKNSLKNLQLIQVIINAVRKNKFVEKATDAEIIFVLTNWFRFAKDRDGGRDNRRAGRSE